MGMAPIRVALVDDDASVRRALRRLLLASGMEVQDYASGADFLDSLARRTPDCLVLDLQMPGMTGLDIQRRLAHDGVKLPTVIITAHDEPGARLRCVNAGAAAYLTKPLSVEILLEAIRRALYPVTLH